MLDGFLVKPVTASMVFDAVVDAKAGYAGLKVAHEVRRQTTRLAGLKLLVVEDNAMNQQVARELLSNEGAQVAVANNGRLGVEAVLTAHPAFDAVLMDVQMPDMDGYAATAEIRQHGALQTLPIIAMTANAKESDRVECLAAGMNDHVGKPIDLEVLVNTLLKHCRTSTNTTSPAVVATAAPIATPTAVLAPARNKTDPEHEKALRRLGSDEWFFSKLATTFTESITSIAADLRRYLGTDANVEAEILLHTAKGLAGTVGATELATFAARTEQQVRSRPNADEARRIVDAFDQLVAKSCSELADFCATFGIQQRVGATEEAPAASILQSLLQLELLVKNRNMKASTVFEHLKATAGPSWQERLRPLEAALNAVDFKSALEQIHRLAEPLQ
jgi:two-component system sensor histidine kinase/response regulator